MTIVNNEAPGVYVNVTAAPPSPNGNAPTGTWFVTGTAQQGPVGVAVPVTSLTQYIQYLGTRTSTSQTLYDSLDEFFHDGGVLAYVSRIVGPAAAAASVVVPDTGTPSPVSTLTVTAAGAGTWGNSVSVVVAAGSASNSYTLSIYNGSTLAASSPNLFVPQDAVTWAASLPSYQVLVTIVNDGSATAPPNNNPAVGTYTLVNGADDFADITEAEWTAGLTAFGENLGPGQVSAPGHTTATGYISLTSHAESFNRVALLDVADNASATSLISQSTTFQSNCISDDVDPSYAAFFAPWVVIPGIYSSNPSAVSPIPTRTVPPSAMAAALMAANDQTNDANQPAAGPDGQSSYAVGVTNQYTASNLGLLNGAGIDIIRPVQNVITLYGYRSTSLDPNWVYLNNVRFRMQVIYDFNLIGEKFIFTEIDGQGHLFAAFNAALAGQCQTWWTNGSIYGASPNAAFQVNTGPQVNTPATIQAGQLNAEVLLHMSAFGEFVTINVTKYLLTNAFPS